MARRRRPSSRPRAGIDARYAREWLEQQAVDRPARRRRRRRRPRRAAATRLPAGHAAVVLDPDDLATMTPVAAGDAQRGRGVAGAARRLPHRRRRRLERRTRAISEVQEAATGPLFRHLLAQEWLPAVPDVDARLRRVAPGSPTSRAAAAGRRSRSRGPTRRSRSTASTSTPRRSSRARAKAREEGLEDRVRFHVVDAGDHSLDGTFDLVDDLRGGPRHVPAGRGARCLPPAAGARRHGHRHGREGRRARSPRRATRSSG